MGPLGDCEGAAAGAGFFFWLYIFWPDIVREPIRTKQRSRRLSKQIMNSPDRAIQLKELRGTRARGRQAGSRQAGDARFAGNIASCPSGKEDRASPAAGPGSLPCRSSTDQPPPD